MTRTFPIVFNQLDFLQHLGTSETTIAANGCYLCSMTTLAVACGKQITPPHLNQAFINYLSTGLYVQGDLMVDDNLTKIYPDIVYQQTLHYETIPADLNELRTLMSDPSTWVILEIDLGSGNTHFVLCAGVNGVVSIADPEGGVVIDFASKYGDPARNILKYVIYKGTPATVDHTALTHVQEQLDSANQTVMSLNQTIKTLGEQNVQSSQNLTEQNTILQNKVNDLTKQILSLNADITELKTDLANLTDENTSIMESYQKVSNDNSLAIKQGLKAPSMIQDFKDYINAIATYLKIPTNQKDSGQVVESILDEVAKLSKMKREQEQEAQRIAPSVSMAIAGSQLKKKHSGLFVFLQNIGVLQK